MKLIFCWPALLAIAAVLLSPLPTVAETTAERDKKRMDLIAGISCSYYVNQGTIKIEYNPGGTLIATVRNIVRPGSWYVENDKFCVALPPSGKVQCNSLRRTAIQTRSEALDYMSNLANSKCYE